MSKIIKLKLILLSTILLLTPCQANETFYQCGGGWEFIHKKSLFSEKVFNSAISDKYIDAIKTETGWKVLQPRFSEEFSNQDEYDAFNKGFNIPFNLREEGLEQLRKRSSFEKALQHCKMGLDSPVIPDTKRGFVKSIKTFWVYEMNEFTKRLQLNYKVDCNSEYQSITRTEDLNNGNYSLVTNFQCEALKR